MCDSRAVSFPSDPLPRSFLLTVRNSWGTLWGEGGHIRLKYGDDECGLADEPTYVQVSSAGPAPPKPTASPPPPTPATAAPPPPPMTGSPPPMPSSNDTLRPNLRLILQEKGLRLISEEIVPPINKLLQSLASSGKLFIADQHLQIKIPSIFLGKVNVDIAQIIIAALSFGTNGPRSC